MFDPFLIISGLTFLIVITILVAAHELGHYWFARLFKMDVDAFAVMVGGLRTTDLSDGLKRRLASGWWVAAALLASLGLWEIAVVTDLKPLVIAAQVIAVLVVPLWIATRLAALYRIPIGRVLQNFALGYGLWFALMTVVGVMKNVGDTGILPLMSVVSILGLLFLYYTPVLKKPEDAPMGIGQIEEGGQKREVRYRPLFSRKSKSGTEFSMLMLPLGGFAAIKGMHPKEDGSETRIPGGFFSRPPWQRFIVLLAGPVFSIAAGVLLLMGVLMVSGIEKPVNVNRLGAVAKDRPADKAGLKEGDTILSVDGRPVGNFYEMLAVVRDQPGKPLRFTYVREGREATTTITPEADKAPSAVLDADLEPTGETRVQGKIGASPPVKKERLALGPAFKHAVVQPWMMASQLFGNFLKPATLQENVGGIATIAAYTDQAARRGLEPVFILAAMLSISLGIFNLLPIYPLDGGQMMVAVAEMFRGGRRLSMRVQNAVSTLGFAIICMLILFVLVVDARRFAGAKDSPSEKQAPAERAAEKPDK